MSKSWTAVMRFCDDLASKASLTWATAPVIFASSSALGMSAMCPTSRAGKLFWSQMEQALFRKKVDAWWLDAPEPDLSPVPTLDGQRTHMHPTALGSGSRMLNAYSLVNSKTVYEGQR